MKLQCWKCGSKLGDILFPFSRYEECSVCKADQHVCLLCKEYDPNISDGCREDRADFVLDKEKANFCDYFKPKANAYRKKDDQQARQARAKLAELFGETPPLDSDKKDGDSAATEAERALQELKKLFGDD